MKTKTTFIFITAILLCVCGTTASLLAQAPNLLNYQGKVLIGGVAVSGPFSMTFSIYPSLSSGTALWTEIQTVTVSKGVFNVLLGSATSFPNNLFSGTGDRYLGIKVGADPEIVPRFRLTSAAFAIRASEADGVADGAIKTVDLADGAVAATKIADNAVTNTKIAAGAVDSTKLASNSVTSEKIATGAINNSDLANNTVTAEKIVAGQVVKNLNGLKDAVILAGKGGATISSNKDTIFVNAGAGDDGIQGVQNTDNSLTILSPNGPTATINVKDGGITNAKIADNAVTTAKIIANAVDSSKIAFNAVTSAKIAVGAVNNSDLANNAVTAGKIAAGQVVKRINGLMDGVTLMGGNNIQITPSGNTLTISASGGGSGDITAVNAGSGLTGGGTSDDVTLSVMTGGINGTLIADNAVTSLKIADGSITAADIATTADIPESKLQLNNPTHPNTNDPTTGEKEALAGTSGAPSSTNKYVTNSDPRNTNARTPTGAASGDLSGTYPNPTVVRLQTRNVSSTAPATGQVLKWDGTQWKPDTDTGGGAGNTLNQAYNQGGAGAGRTITANAGAVNIAGPDGLTISDDGGIGIGTTTAPNAKDDQPRLDIWAKYPSLYQIRTRGLYTLNFWDIYHNSNDENDFGLVFRDHTEIPYLVLGHLGNRSSSTVKNTFFPFGNVTIGNKYDVSPHQEELYVFGNIRATGSITQVSSREYKENISELSLQEAVFTVKDLNPVKFTYNADKQKDVHVGFIAEEVPDLVATPDRKGISPMDVIAVLAKVVQEQQKAIVALQEKVDALQQQIK